MQPGGRDGLARKIADTRVDERFAPFLEAWDLMLDWARTVARDGYTESFPRVVHEAVVGAEPPLRFNRALAGLLITGVATGLRPHEIVAEVAPVFRERETLFPSAAARRARVTDADLGSGRTVTYDDRCVGYLAGNFETREFQQSDRDPDVFYHVDEFAALIEVNSRTARSRVIAHPFGPATRERRRRLYRRGGKVNDRRPMDHPFYYSETEKLLYAAVHSRVFEVWDTLSSRRIYQSRLSDDAVVLHSLPDGTVRIAVRETGLLEYDGTSLRPRRLTGVEPGLLRFFAIAPRRWNGHAVYGVVNGLLFVPDTEGPAGFFPLPNSDGDRILSFSVTSTEIIITTSNRYVHVLHGAGVPWRDWRTMSMRAAHYLSVAPDSAQGIAFDRHSESDAWSVPWSYAHVEDVRKCEASLARPNVIRMANLTQIIPTVHAHGRFTVWQEGTQNAGMRCGTSTGGCHEFAVRQPPTVYRDAIQSADGSVVALGDWLSPASIAVADSTGFVIATTEFPRVESLLAIDSVKQTLTLRGRCGLEMEQAIAEADARPELSRWTWHWRSNTWTEEPARFHGCQPRGSRHRDHITMFLADGGDLKFSAVAGVGCVVQEADSENELIITSEAVHRVSIVTGEDTIHPLRPLLYGWPVGDVQVDVRTAVDRAWMGTPGGLVSGFSLHDAKRLWRVRLPGYGPKTRAPRVRYQAVEGRDPLLVVWSEEGRVSLVLPETGELLADLEATTDLYTNSFPPVVTASGVLLSVDEDVICWKP